MFTNARRAAVVMVAALGLAGVGLAALGCVAMGGVAAGPEVERVGPLGKAGVGGGRLPEPEVRGRAGGEVAGGQREPVRAAGTGETTLRKPEGLGRVEWYVQFSERGDRPESKGLGATLRWPDDVTLDRKGTAIVYEWRPEDGKEKRDNPRTGKPWGPIMKPSLAEMMERENLARHLETMGTWLDAWVARDYAGVVCIDIESYGLKTDDFHFNDKERAAQSRLHPGKENGALLREFVTKTIERARVLRPRVTGWGWFGLGEVHPAYVLWKPEGLESLRRQARRDAEVLAAVDVAMPVFYFPTIVSDAADRQRAWKALAENWKLGYGEERMREGYAYLNAQHHYPGNEKHAKTLSREELRECVQAAMDAGVRRMIVWGTIGDRGERDALQEFVREVLAPVARESGAR